MKVKNRVSLLELIFDGIPRNMGSLLVPSHSIFPVKFHSISTYNGFHRTAYSGVCSFFTRIIFGPVRVVRNCTEIRSGLGANFQNIFHLNLGTGFFAHVVEGFINFVL